jgi:hypothetical protein
MAVALASSIALDRWVLNLRKMGHATLHLGPSLLGTAVAVLAAVSLVLLIGWHVAYRRRGGRLVGILYLAIGLALLAFPPLAFSELSQVLGLNAPALRDLRLFMLQSSGVSLFQLTSAATVAIGIAALIPGRGSFSGKPAPA